jgi:hypothetical protein
MMPCLHRVLRTITSGPPVFSLLGRTRSAALTSIPRHRAAEIADGETTSINADDAQPCGRVGQDGVACFTEKVHDILMWAKQGDVHGGLCLEFDTRFDPFQSATSCSYADAIPSMNVLANPYSSLALMTTKSKQSDYE